MAPQWEAWPNRLVSRQWCRTVRVIKAKNSALSMFFKAVHSLYETKTLGIILRPRTMFVPVSAFLLFVVSAVTHVEECALFGVFSLFFTVFFANFATIKRTFPKI